MPNDSTVSISQMDAQSKLAPSSARVCKNSLSGLHFTA
jgi:hypothetical protein